MEINRNYKIDMKSAGKRGSWNFTIAVFSSARE